MYKYLFKQAIDYLIAIILLFMCSPIFLFVTITLYFANQGEPFFYQTRPGKGKVLFKIIKFRTMNNKKDKTGTVLPDAERLTKVGAFVRKSSLDELPQLINILKGEMSLIGPRPLLPEYLPLYTPEQAKRHFVKPGITGLAQIKGRNQMKFSERLKYDTYYVENLSFSLDFQILLLTIYTVLFKSKNIVHGQTVDEVDDLGLSRNLSSNHFKKSNNEHNG